MSTNRAVVAMSGGVDSSVAAALLKEAGYEVIGVTMQLWPDDRPPGERPGGCCGIDAIERARRSAARLEIPHYVMDFREAFEKSVIADFCEEYQKGRTPNPCIRCNQFLKFDKLLKKAQELDADYLATGHYARIEESPEDYHLLKAIDRTKDQSYFLYTLGQAELAHLKFPLGDWRKTEVRAKAANLGLPTAAAPESHDICFIEDGNYRGFLEKHAESSRPGDIIDTEGNILGKHKGLAGYTIGQRHGLGLGTNQPRYVIRLDIASNQLVVGASDKLLGQQLIANHLSWVSGKPPTTQTVMAKIRYRATEAEAELKLDKDRASVIFKEPQRAITPGQAVVFYRGEEVLGGGIIESEKNS